MDPLTSEGGRRRKHLDDAGTRVGQHFHHDRRNAALGIRHGVGVRIVGAPERRADVAFFNQLPQFAVHHVAVFEPRSDQGAMAAAMSRPAAPGLGAGWRSAPPWPVAACGPGQFHRRARRR